MEREKVICHLHHPHDHGRGVSSPVPRTSAQSEKVL
jgi:hypothetical protein